MAAVPAYVYASAKNPRKLACLIDGLIDICISVIVKNITVTVDDDTYRRARIKAAERETSVSALVKQFLSEFAGGPSDTDRMKLNEKAMRDVIPKFSAAERMTRDETHGRRK